MYNISEIGNWNYGRECGFTNLHQSEEGDIWNPIKMLVDQMSLVCNIYINPELNNLFANYSKIFFLSVPSIVQSGMEKSNLKKC